MNVKILLILTLGFIPFAGQAGDAAKGKAISSACAACHGSYGLSNSDQYPNLAGQKEAYLVKALQGYQSGKRIDTTMQAEVGPLSAQDIENLAAYFAGNSTLPSYSSDNRILNIPFVKVLSELYQVEMGQDSDTVFSLKTVNKLP